MMKLMKWITLNLFSVLEKATKSFDSRVEKCLRHADGTVADLVRWIGDYFYFLRCPYPERKPAVKVFLRETETNVVEWVNAKGVVRRTREMATNAYQTIFFYHED